MTMLHSPRAIEMEKRLAPYLAQSKMSSSELDLLAHKAGRLTRIFGGGSTICFCVAFYSLLTCSETSFGAVLTASASLPAGAMLLLSFFWDSREQDARRLDGEDEIQQALTLISASTAAQKWKNEIARSERFMRGFDLIAMATLAEVEKIEAEFMAINTAG